jgi:IBR domain, a half RING-finger domain
MSDDDGWGCGDENECQDDDDDDEWGGGNSDEDVDDIWDEPVSNLNNDERVLADIDDDDDDHDVDNNNDDNESIFHDSVEDAYSSYAASSSASSSSSSSSSSSFFMGGIETPTRDDDSNSAPSQFDICTTAVARTLDQVMEVMDADVLQFAADELVVDTYDKSMLVLSAYGFDRQVLDWEFSQDDGLARIAVKAGLVGCKMIGGVDFVAPTTTTSVDEHDEQVDDGEDCSVCWNPLGSVAALCCGHRYCRTCWRDHIHAKLCSDGESRVLCMAPGCGAAVPLSFAGLFRCACPTDSVTKMRKALLRLYIGGKRMLQCSNRRCEALIENRDEAAAVRCQRCDFVFCWACRKSGLEYADHRPATCKQRRIWDEKETELAEDASMNFIKNNARKCPFCPNWQIRVPGSCNHIVCGRNTHGTTQGQSSGCGKAWCWFCCRPWSECGYSCNQEGKQKFERDRAEAAAYKEKFLRFFDRYHDTSGWLKEHAGALLRDADIRAQQYEGAVETFSNLDPRTFSSRLFDKGARAEIEGRRLLLNTYIVSYFMKEHPRLAFFEMCQSKLEETSDRLVRVNRVPIDKLSEHKLRKAIELSQKWTRSMRATINEIVRDQEDGESDDDDDDDERAIGKGKERISHSSGDENEQGDQDQDLVQAQLELMQATGWTDEDMNDPELVAAIEASLKASSPSRSSSSSSSSVVRRVRRLFGSK